MRRRGFTSFDVLFLASRVSSALQTRRFISRYPKLAVFLTASLCNIVPHGPIPISLQYCNFTFHDKAICLCIVATHSAAATGSFALRSPIR
jgi:hypothetical protein